MKPNLFNHLNVLQYIATAYVRSFQVPSASNAHSVLNLVSQSFNACWIVHKVVNFL